MPRLRAGEVTQDRRARKIKIADRIEHLVAHELVGIAQAALVEHLVAVNHHRIVERTATGEAHLTQLLNFMQEAKGARAGDFVLEYLLG